MATRRLSGIATSSSVPDNGGDHSGGGGGGGGYVDDVFSTYLYEGDGTQYRTIETGIDLAGEDGLLWLKNRTVSNNHFLFDTKRGTAPLIESLTSNNSDPSVASEIVTSLGSNGFTTSQYLAANQAGDKYASWTFRKAKNFFDVVTYTGDGNAEQVVPHGLGANIGIVMIKRLDASQSWGVWHKDAIMEHKGNIRSLHGILNEAIDFGNYGYFPIIAEDVETNFTDKHFTVAGASYSNVSGAQYVAYLFAHDDSDESMIKCGSYTGTGATGNEIDLGWEPQWVLIKSASRSAAWYLQDVMRGFGSVDLSHYFLEVNSTAEERGPGNNIVVTPTGFQLVNAPQGFNAFGEEYIYMAIRRPNKPAEEFDPDELFGISYGDGTGAPSFKGVLTDFKINTTPASTLDNYIGSRLQGAKTLKTNSSDAEGGSTSSTYDFMNGWGGTTGLDSSWLSWMWRRAPGFFDVVTYEGDGQAGRELPHNLGVKPEMIWTKCRNHNGRNWSVYAEPAGYSQCGLLNMPGMFEASQMLAAPPTADNIILGANANANYAPGWTYVAYLFASVPGISAIGTYTGDGSGYQVIYPDGLSGASIRFVLVKRVDGNGNWMMFDRERGTDAALSLNLTDAQKTGDFWSWTFGAFGVKNNNAHGPEWNPNTNGAEYLYYAITL